MLTATWTSSCVPAHVYLTSHTHPCIIPPKGRIQSVIRQTSGQLFSSTSGRLRAVRFVFSATRQAFWFFLMVKTREFVVMYILCSITLFVNVSRVFHVYFQERRGVASQPLTLSYIQYLLCSVRAIRETTVTTRAKSSSSQWAYNMLYPESDSQSPSSSVTEQ